MIKTFLGKRMMQVICISACVMIVGGIIFYRSIEAVYFAIGVILTSSLNIWKVILLERTVAKTLDMDDAEAGKNYVRFQYLLRYFLTAIVLLGAGLISARVDPPFISIWGAVAGIFTLQIAVIATRGMKREEDDEEAGEESSVKSGEENYAESDKEKPEEHEKKLEDANEVNVNNGKENC